MQKLGKTFFPTAARVGNAALARPGPGALLFRTAALSNGQTVRFATFQRPGASPMTSASSSRTSSSGQDQGVQTDIHLREVGLLPTASPTRTGLLQGRSIPPAGVDRDTKGVPALDPPDIDADFTVIQQSGALPGVTDDPTVDALYAQMHEHESSSSTGQDMQESVVALLEQASALGDSIDPAKEFINPNVFEMTSEEVQAWKRSNAQKDRSSGPSDSDVIRRATIKLESEDWRQVLRQYVHSKGGEIVAVFATDELNAGEVNQKKDPPWKACTKAAMVRYPPGTKFWQVVTDEPNAQGESQLGGLLAGKPYFGAWYLLSAPGDANEARLLAAIRKQYKGKLSDVASVITNRAVIGLLGVAGKQPGGLPGGAAQFQCHNQAAMELEWCVRLILETPSKDDV